MAHAENETQALLRLVSLGNEAAAARLLNIHRKRLKKMVNCRIDQDVAARHDPSDVVQETILAAANKLPEYLKKQDVPFYAWLRRMAWLRLAELHRQHADKGRDENPKADFRHGSLTPKCLSEMVRRFGPNAAAGSAGGNSADVQRKDGSSASASGSSKSSHLARKTKAHVQGALLKLEPATRELLLLYYVEQLTVPEIAAVLELEAPQVKLRHVRAIRKMRTLLDRQNDETPP